MVRRELPPAFFIGLGLATLSICVLQWVISGDLSALFATAGLLGWSLTVSILVIDRIGLRPQHAHLQPRHKTALKWATAAAPVVLLIAVAFSASLESLYYLLAAVPIPVASSVAGIVLMVRRSPVATIGAADVPHRRWTLEDKVTVDAALAVAAGGAVIIAVLLLLTGGPTFLYVPLAVGLIVGFVVLKERRRS